MMDKLEPCPYCGGKAVVTPFIYEVAALPKPIPLFGGYSLVKMRYREIPCKYVVECDDVCDGFCENDIFAIGETKESAVAEWNKAVVNFRLNRK